jgi:multidrug efflux pump subunit AcrA (membrane-fusion protein)
MNTSTTIHPDAVLGGKSPDRVMPPSPPEPEEPNPGKPSARRLVDEVPLHSEQVEDVLGVPPRWLVRWGNTLLAGALGTLLAMSWVVHYPDVVPARVVVTTLLPPSPVIARANGELTEVRVRSGDLVRRGDQLAIIRNAADPAAVFKVKALLDKWGADLSSPDLTQELPEGLALGELQPDYSTFARDYRSLKYDVAQDPVSHEIRYLEPQLQSQQQRLQSLRRQRDNLLQQVNLAEREVQRSRELAAEHMVSNREVDTKQKDALTARQAVSTTEVDMSTAQVDIDRISQSLANLRNQARSSREQLRITLSQSAKNLRSHLDVWERNYVLRAAADGRVNLFKVWADHQPVRDGDSVMTVVHEGTQALVGRVSMPISNSGKVQPGQAVHIRLDNFPWQEFGQLKGVVKSISAIPEDGNYLVEVALPQGLRTTYGRQLEFRQEMQGQAHIVVEDLRLLQRLVYQFRSLWAGTGPNLQTPVSSVPGAAQGQSR